MTRSCFVILIPIIALPISVGCGTTPDPGCTPIEKIGLTGDELGKRIREAYDALKKQGADPKTTMATFDCKWTFRVPLSQSDPSEVKNVDNGPREFPIDLLNIASCFELAKYTGPGGFMNCITDFMKFGVETGVKLQPGIRWLPWQRDGVKAINMQCKPKSARVLPDTRFLNRDPGPEVLIPVLIQLLDDGARLVPSPASIPFLFPGAKQVDEEACLDLPEEPRARCTDTAGCPDVPPEGAEPPDQGGVILRPITSGGGSSSGGDL